MGNIQSFNNFASVITNTFSLPFINKTLVKNNLQKITMKQYSQFKKEGYTQKDIIQLKSLYSKLSNQEYITLKNWIRDYKSGSGEKFKFEAIVEFNSLKKQYSDITVSEYINLKDSFETFEKILDYYILKHIDRDLTPGIYKDYLDHFKTFYKAKQYLEGKGKQYIKGKKLDRNLTIDKYEDYLKELKTSKDVIKYLTFNRLYPRNNLTVKDYKDILHHNLKQDKVAYFIALKKDSNLEKLTVEYFKELSDRNLTPKQMNDFLLLKKIDQDNVLTVDDMKQLARKIPDLKAKLGFVELKNKFIGTFTVDEYKQLLDKNYIPREMWKVLHLKSEDKTNLLTDDEIKRLIDEFYYSVISMTEFIEYKKIYNKLTVDEYKNLLDNKLESSEIRQFLQEKKKDDTLTLRRYKDIKQRKNKQNQVFNGKQTKTQIQNAKKKLLQKDIQKQTKIQNTKKQLLQKLNQKNFLQLYQGGYKFTQKEINTYLNPFLKRNSTLINRPTLFRKLGNDFTIDETTGTIVQL